MTQIDERFLSVHPRTALWWKQREKCAQCVHYDVLPGTPKTGGGTVCRSMAAGGPNKLNSAITARDEGHVCGPAAALFVAKQLEAA